MMHPAFQGAPTTPHQSCPMARLQAHPRAGGTHPLPVRPHHPGGLGTLQDMPPPYGLGHTSGLVPGGNPTATRRLASPQPGTPGHRTPPQGSPRQGFHYERGGDTGPTPTPHQARRKPDGGGSAHPASSSPQSRPNGTPQTPPADTHGAAHRPHRQGTHVASHPLPCRACPRSPLTCSAPHTRPPSPSGGLQDTSGAPQKATHRKTPPPQAPTTPQSPPLTQGTTQRRPAQPSPPRTTHTSTWTRRTLTDHPAEPPPDPEHPLPLTPTTIRDPDLLLSGPSRQGLRYSPRLVRPTTELDRAHPQSPPGPSQPRERPPRGHRRPRPLASPPTRPRPARLDPPHPVGPGPDTRHRHQRHTSRDDKPTTSPSGEGPPSRPEPSGTVITGHRTEPRHRPPCGQPAHPQGRPPPPPTDSNHPLPEVWCTVLRRGHYYVVAATATSPGPQWLVKGTDTMVAPAAAPPGPVGDPTTPLRVLRGVLQPGD